jgi:hypothetical protein
MDTIEDRIWDIDGQKYVNAEDINETNKTTRLYLQRLLGKEICKEEYIDINRFAYLKYTNFFDEKGTRICKDDFVKDKEHNISQIIFKDDCFFVKHDKCTIKNIDNYILKHNNSLKIIGNIWENPRLRFYMDVEAE